MSSYSKEDQLKKNLTPVKSNKRPKKVYKTKKKKKRLSLEFPQHIKNSIKIRDNGCYLCTKNKKANYLHIHHFIYKSAFGLGIIENGIALCNKHHTDVHRHDIGFKLRDELQAYLDRLYPSFDNSMRKYRKWK